MKAKYAYHGQEKATATTRRMNAKPVIAVAKQRKKKDKEKEALVPTKVPYHPFNYRMAAAIFIRMVSRHGKVTMRYWMKPPTAPPGEKRWS
ncbi:hypothetical protein AVEN_258511-1 [Araneus ventricosus]|uniref:Uncharacterized protein n=1 Tax=Araneus ventricosus TaxID=182803 RepID=A0A4Y2GXI1_ARAVE|nr:hypothetical protein AVEN_258511-1 [Araneus ventricosus]